MDALYAGAISDFVGSAVAIGASAAILPVVIGGTEEVSPGVGDALAGLTNLESPLLGLIDRPLESIKDP
jgi:hypothetical protein